MEEEKLNYNKKDGIKTVRTYMSDMADTVRDNEISVIKVALAEQNKHEREDLYRKVEGTPTKKVFWFLGGIILVAIAISGTYFIIQQKAKQDIPEQITKEETLISYDEISSISVTDPDELTNKINEVKKETGATGKNNNIKFISLSQEVNDLQEKIPTQELFLDLGFTAPSSLVRSLSDSYMIGTYANNMQNNLFIIFQTKDYEYAYTGMLEWEKTLASDMLPLFELDTKESKIKISDRKWSDIIINNKDVRVLVNEDGKPILYYLFTDKSSLIIANDESTIKEIVAKLILKNIKPL